MVRIRTFIKETHMVPISSAIRTSGLDPSELDAVTVMLEGDEWGAMSWLFTDDEVQTADEKADALIVILKARGPDNVPGPEVQLCYFDCREPKTGPSQTEAPPAGWTNKSSLANLDRKNLVLEVVEGHA